MNPEMLDPYKILMSFNFWLIAMANFGVVVTIKQTLKKINQAHKLDTVWADIALVSLPLWLGGVIGYFILNEDLSGGVRVLTGVTAGFLNPMAMKVLEKIAPTWVVSAYDPARQNNVSKSE